MWRWCSCVYHTTLVAESSEACVTAVYSTVQASTIAHISVHRPPVTATAGVTAAQCSPHVTSACPGQLSFSSRVTSRNVSWPLAAIRMKHNSSLQVFSTLTAVTALLLSALTALSHPSLAPPLDPLSLWQLPYPNISDDAAGYPVLHHLSTRSVFVASNESSRYGTYSHHPHVLVVNGSSPVILVSFSNGLTDEDADGQQVLFRVSYDSAHSFAHPVHQLFPPALRPGEQPSLWQADTLQRAMCSEGFLQTEDHSIIALAELYGQSEVNITGEPQGWKATGFGRVVRRVVDPHWPPVLGPLCWVQPSRYAATALTGTPYDPATLPLCDDSAELVHRLSSGRHQPAWSWSLMSDNHPVLAGNGSVEDGVSLAEPTHAFPFTSDPHTVCRFWRTLAPPPNRTEYVECAQSASADYNEWYNGTDESAVGAYGPYASILKSNIPDVGSKSVLLALPSSSRLTHIYVSNPCPRASGDRFPLTIATSEDNTTLTSVHALHATAPPRARYDGRYKNWGVQYPSVAVQHSADGGSDDDDRLFVVYSVNKEDIHISTTRLKELQQSQSRMGSQTKATEID